MEGRFIKESNANITDLATKEYNSIITAWGKIDLTVDTPTGKRIVGITNVAYILGYVVNLLSSIRLENKGVYFVPEFRHLHKDNKPIIFVKRFSKHYVLENNTYSEDGTFANSKVILIKSAISSEWHQLLAYANNDVIEYLLLAAEGVEVVDTAKSLDISNYEICVLAKAYRIVLRSLFKAETSDQPFFRITYNLIDLNTALNQHSQVSYFSYYKHNFQLVYIYKYKGEATDIIREAIKIIRTRYKYEVVFIRSDGERSLGTVFRNLINELGVTFEPSVPATSAQNGHSERKGSLLGVKARALLIEAGLPEFLQP